MHTLKVMDTLKVGPDASERPGPRDEAKYQGAPPNGPGKADVRPRGAAGKGGNPGLRPCSNRRAGAYGNRR